MYKCEYTCKHMYTYLHIYTYKHFELARILMHTQVWWSLHTIALNFTLVHTVWILPLVDFLWCKLSGS